MPRSVFPIMAPLTGMARNGRQGPPVHLPVALMPSPQFSLRPPATQTVARANHPTATIAASRRATERNQSRTGSPIADLTYVSSGSNRSNCEESGK